MRDAEGDPLPLVRFQALLFQAFAISGFAIGPQSVTATWVAESVQRLLLDLTDPLTSQAKACPDLLEGHGLFAVQAKVELEDLRLPVNQCSQRGVDMPSQAAAQNEILW